MRTAWARWATCALAISICMPVAAKNKKSLADCTSFTQTEKGEDAFELSVHNSCKAQLDCSISWKVVCAPQSTKRRAVHPHNQKFTLTAGTGNTVEASAASCGDEAFSIEHVTWSCEPSKD